MFVRFSKCSILGASLLLASCGLFSSEEVKLEGKRLDILDYSSSVVSDYSARGYNISLPKMQYNDSWFQDGGNSEHRMPHLSGSDKMLKKWSAKFGSGASKGECLLASPVVTKNTVFTIDADATLSSFSLEDGSRIWERKLKPSVATQKSLSMKGAGLAVSAQQKSLFATTGFGVVYSVDTETGKRKWKQDIEIPIRIAPTIGGGNVFVQTVDNTLIALDAKTGEEHWRAKSSSEATIFVGGASPAYSFEKDVIIAAFSNGEVSAYKASTGSPLWTYYLAPKVRTNSLSGINSIKANPIISNNIVYIAGTNDLLVAIDLINGSNVWEKPIGTSNNMHLVGNYLFALNNNFEVVALNAKDGSVYWSTKIVKMKEQKDKIGALAVGPLLINDKLIVLTSKGYIFALSPYNGSILTSTELGYGVEVSPIVAAGHTIISASNGRLEVYN